MDSHLEKPFRSRRFVPAVILLLCLAGMAISADAASTRMLPATTPATLQYRVQPMVELVPLTPQTIACQAPCSCMERSRAIIEWGSDGFTQCAENPCGFSSATAGVPIEKYCLKQKTATAADVAPLIPLVTLTQTHLSVVTMPAITQTTVVPQQLVTASYSVLSDDSDQDSIPDEKDTCPSIFNPGQDDADRIFIGCPAGAVAKMPDAASMALCAELTVEAVRKKCEEAAWAKANPGFTGAGCNYNRDGKGDVCDNCREVQNADQADSDGDCASFKKDPAFHDGTQWLKDPQCGNTCDRCPGFDDSKDADHNGVPDDCDPCLQDPAGITFRRCNGVCADTLTDSGNCGGCGQICPGGSVCCTGICIPDSECVSTGFDNTDQKRNQLFDILGGIAKSLDDMYKYITHCLIGGC